MLNRLKKLALPALRRAAPAQAGSASIEAAIALPVFFSLLLGVISIGQIITSYVFAVDALRQASREAMLGGTGCQAAALNGVRSRVSAFYFAPEISGLVINMENRGDVHGAVFELSGRLTCSACGMFLTGGLGFQESTFVPLEQDLSCSI